MKKLIITITHTNYCLISAGTEKFVREYSQLLQKNGYVNLVFFPIAQHKVKIKKKIGAILNDRFVGLFDYDKIEDIVDFYAQENSLSVSSIHLQHLQGHDLCKLQDLIKHYNVPTYLFVHDYYMICNNVKLINSQGETCGYDEPSLKKCAGCVSYPGVVNHCNEINLFLNNIDKWLARVVVPSDFVYGVIANRFAFLKSKLEVRNHLVLSGKNKLEIVKDKVKIAFVGAQVKEKGFDRWEELVRGISAKCADEYEFYYFGYGNKDLENVNRVYVSNVGKESCSMEDALRQHGISCALMWCEWGETYSYVYYEMSLAGVYVLTNEISGNVTIEVKKNKNGMIFKDFNECLQWLENVSDVKRCINEYRNNPLFAPTKSEANKKLYNDIKDDDGIALDVGCAKKVRKSLWTYIYILKHILFHNGEANVLFTLKK